MVAGIFFHSWDGVSFFFRMPSISSFPDLFVASDTDGSTGFGAFWRNRWFTGMWPHSMHEVSITVLELFPIVVAAHVWGSSWGRQKVEFYPITPLSSRSLTPLPPVIPRRCTCFGASP